MLSAKEARKIVDDIELEQINKTLDDIEKKIIEISSQGRIYCTYCINQFSMSQQKIIKHTLIDKGYDAKLFIYEPELAVYIRIIW